ncbi:MAG: ribosome maturation factor RimM [Desulfatibacillaceae bacterium]
MEEGVFVEMGKVVGVHGIRGAVKVVSHAGNSDLLAPGSEVYLVHRGETGTYVIDRVSPHKKILRIFFQGVGDRDEAEALVGGAIMVERARLPEPEPGEYYWIDLIGLSVSTAQGVPLGRLTSIIPTGANDVYVVRDEEGDKEWLVPALDWVILSVDIENGAMVVDLPEGL